MPDVVDELDSTAVTPFASHGIDADFVPHQLQVAVIGLGTFVVHTVESATITIGRSGQCDITIDDESLSRRHATLKLGPTVTVEDLGSVNGTRVRGQLIQPGTAITIAVGEPINLGTLSIILQPRAPKPRAAKSGTDHPVSEVVISDPRMQSLHRLVEQIADSRLCVLLLGETGVGKEVFARAVHRRSQRAAGPFVEINCAALAESLLESELFGHERGSFTNATSTKIGLIESAEGGTLLLDEIGEMPLVTQAKLLRVIEDLQVRKVGALKPRAIDVRFIAATNLDLEAQIAHGTFRSDLFYRLNGVTIVVPPLRERLAEIEPLARAFVERAYPPGRNPPALLPETVALLEQYHWPGNVRELKHMIDRAMLLCGDGPIRPEHLPAERLHARAETPTIRVPQALRDRQMPPPKGSPDEHKWIMDALAVAGGNQTVAARILGMSRRTLVSRLTDHNVERPRKAKDKKPDE